MPSVSSYLEIVVGARGSQLSQAQVLEVHQELSLHHPQIRFYPIWVTTQGDRDKTTSLRLLDKTDFFTREVDERQLKGEFRIAIHSAKDLPDPLAHGLKVVAITRGVDASDVIVYNQEPFPERGVIGTSSVRREETLLKQWPHARCIDIRGTIEERLAWLDAGKGDGVVMAKAALIRLGLSHRRHLQLSGETAPLQGRLAILARENDDEMKALFACLNSI